MKVEWKLQDAKSRFSELVRRAEEEGPQTVTRHGEEVVVVVPVEEYRGLLSGGREDFREFLSGAPDSVGFDLRRDGSPSRLVEFEGSPRR